MAPTRIVAARSAGRKFISITPIRVTGCRLGATRAKAAITITEIALKNTPNDEREEIMSHIIIIRDTQDGTDQEIFGPFATEAELNAAADKIRDTFTREDVDFTVHELESNLDEWIAETKEEIGDDDEAKDEAEEEEG